MRLDDPDHLHRAWVRAQGQPSKTDSHRLSLALETKP
jgi:hypothetical protein